MKPTQHIDVNDLAERYGDFPALQSSSRQVLWSKLPDAIYRWQSRLNFLSLKSGDPCALFMPPSIDTILILFAMWSKGIIAVPLNTRMPIAQLGALLQRIRCKVLISATEMVEWHAANIRLERTSNLLKQQITLTGTKMPLFPLRNNATILFTSGSSGTNKACLHTMANHYFSALGSNENIPLTPGDRWLLSLPLYHVAGIGILFRCLISGATICVSENQNPVEAIHAFQPTHLSLISTQLFRLLQQWDTMEDQLSQLRAVLLGGSAISPTLTKEAHSRGLPLFTSYGSTEMASQITTTRPNDSPEHLSSSGKLLKYRELEIDKTGEILVRGQTLFKGYIEKNSLVPERDENGWFHTADLGEIDQDGYLHVLGRKDNMFISGGENIHPEEIEREILQVEHVKRVVVVAVKNDEFGERPVAFLDTNTFEQTKQEIRDLLQERLPKYKWPDYFFAWPTIDEQGLKIQRNKFQKIANELLRDSAHPNHSV